ncbi:MAG: SDR family oxidoreductase [Anaerolineae bacterium]|nr:SDR family oxidoreductase [Anaerolineae bacterium]HRX01515.1 SDR family oxidoreductase [Anaerolineae bacterium]
MTDTVLVTGISTGFGQEIALMLGEKGYTVYGTVRDMSLRPKLEAMAVKRNADLRVVQMDVTDQSSIDAAVDKILEECGSIYAVVNNAGVLLRGYFEDLAEDEIRNLFNVNFFGALAVTRAVLPAMRQARRGRVVIISSVAGKIGAPSGSAYSACRFAQEGFAESLRQEMQPLGVTVSLIEPGITRTETWQRGTASGVGRNAANPDSPYYAWFKQAQTLFYNAMESSKITVEDVAGAVFRAISEPKPRWRYVVGPRAKLVISARRYIPGELFERFYFGEVVKRITTPAR